MVPTIVGLYRHLLEQISIGTRSTLAFRIKFTFWNKHVTTRNRRFARRKLRQTALACRCLLRMFWSICTRSKSYFRSVLGSLVANLAFFAVPIFALVLTVLTVLVVVFVFRSPGLIFVLVVTLTFFFTGPE